MRGAFVIAALAAALLPAAAYGLTPAQLDCATARAPAGLGENIAAAMIALDRTRLGPLQEQLGRIVGQCVRANRLTDPQGEAYYDYALARLPREALARQLARAGVAAARIDAAMGFGPGRSNRALNDLEETERAAAMDALKAGGIDEARLGSANWAKVLTYIDLTPRMYRYLAALG